MLLLYSLVENISFSYIDLQNNTLDLFPLCLSFHDHFVAAKADQCKLKINIFHVFFLSFIKQQKKYRKTAKGQKLFL